MTTYRNFDLLLTRAGERYKAIAVDAPEGEESVTFDPPFGADAPPRLADLVRAMGRGATRHAGAALDLDPAASLVALGSQLFSAVFGGKLGNLLAASQASAAGEGMGLRLRLRFEEDAVELALLPWETLYDPAQRQFVGLGETSPILRYLALPRSRSALLVEPPLRMLAALASPTDLPALDIEREWQAVRNALAALMGESKFVLERLVRPTLNALQERLLGEPLHILHFVGHGLFDAYSQIGNLAFEDAHGRAHLVQGDDLAKLLRNHPTVRLAYLNACDGALPGGGSVFTGVAQTLVQGGLPAVVAMQAEISDVAAIELARTFYTAVAAGRPVDAALTQARVTLSAAGSGEWAVPVLFSRSPDNRLFDLRQVLPTPACPYPGMAPFNETQHELFFGRDRDIEEAVARLRQHPFLAVIGPSGSGKSSLIYAGVIPTLRRSQSLRPSEWAIKTMRPGDSRTADGKAAPHQALAALLGCAPDAVARQFFTQRTLLFVDQFEELFTLAATGEAQAFLDALAALIGQPNLSILLAARADFYPELMACSLWSPIKANRLELSPLGNDGLWAAIIEPAARVGVLVDEALAVQLIADAAGERGSLPLMQETLVLLWDRVKERQLHLKDYQALAEGGRNGLQVAIDRRASLIYNNLPEAAQPIARRIVLRLVQFGEGRADTRRQQSAAELCASRDDQVVFEATLARLVASRLLTATAEAGDLNRRVDIAHEALIEGWPRLKEWLDQRRAAEQTRRRLEGKAAEWKQMGQRGGLLDAYELQEAERWLASEDAAELGYSRDLTDLVQTSRDTLAQAATEKEAQRQREMEQAQKLAAEQRLRAEEGEAAARAMSKRFRYAVAAAVIALVFLGIAAASAFIARGARLLAQAEAWNAVNAAATATVAQGEAEVQAQNAVEARATAEANAAEAQAQARRAQANELAARARLMRDQDAELALLLAQAAVQSTYGTDIYVTTNAVDALFYTLAGPLRGRSQELLAADRLPQPLRQEAAPDLWDALAQATASLNVQVADDPRPGGDSWREVLFIDFIDSISLSRDSNRVVTVECRALTQQGNCPSKIARLRDAGSGEAVAELATSDRDVLYAGFGGNEDAVVTVARGGLAQIWNSRGRLVRQVEGVTGDVTYAAISQDGSSLLTRDADGAVRQWALGGSLISELDVKAPLQAAALRPDSTEVLVMETSRPFPILWDYARGQRVQEYQAAFHGTTSFASIADEAAGALAVLDPTRLVVWDAEGRVATALRGASINAGVTSAQLSHDGKRIVVAHTDGRFSIWDVRSGQLILQSAVAHQGGTTAAVFSSAGRQIATGGEDGAVRLWDAANGRLILAFDAAPAGPVLAVDFAPDGSRLVSAGTDGTARVWDTGSGRLLLSLQQPLSVVQVARYSPNGSQIATATADGAVRLWDAASGVLLLELDACHACAVNSVSWRPDGRRLVTAGADGFVRQWQVWPDTEAAQAEAARRAGRSLTPQEHKLYMSTQGVP